MESEKYAVIFKTKRSLPMPDEYVQISQKLVELAKLEKGFLGIDTVADSKGNGVSIVLWDSLESLKKWKNEKLHLYAQEKGKSEWYIDYSVQICRVLNEYDKNSQIRKTKPIEAQVLTEPDEAKSES